MKRKGMGSRRLSTPTGHFYDFRTHRLDAEKEVNLSEWIEMDCKAASSLARTSLLSSIRSCDVSVCKNSLEELGVKCEYN